jgi:GTP-binding protein
MIQQVSAQFPEQAVNDAVEQGTKVAIIGKPNVGKSTLVNRLLGEERVVVYDQPGTTRDSIFLPLERFGKHYTLIDTAGVRRKGKIKETVEKFSVVKTLQAIKEANVVVFMIDARENIGEHDLHLLGYVLDAGRALVIAVNKWDGLSSEQKDDVKSELARRLSFLDYAHIHFISALHGTGVGDLYELVDEAYASAMIDMPTPQLTALLEKAVFESQPPLVGGRRIKLRYAHAGGHNPPLIIVHGNQTAKLPGHYKRYLANFFRKHLKLMGTPLKLDFKTGDNPYKDIRNVLTQRQERRKKRVKKLFKR